MVHCSPILCGSSVVAFAAIVTPCSLAEDRRPERLPECDAVRQVFVDQLNLAASSPGSFTTRWTEDVYLIDGLDGRVTNEGLLDLDRCVAALDPRQAPGVFEHFNSRTVQTTIVRRQQVDSVWISDDEGSAATDCERNDHVALSPDEDPAQVYYIDGGEPFQFLPAENILTLQQYPSRVGMSGHEHLFHGVYPRFGAAARGDPRVCLDDARDMNLVTEENRRVITWQCPDNGQGSQRIVIGTEPQPHVRQWWRIIDFSGDDSNDWRRVGRIWMVTDWQQSSAGPMPARALSMRVAELENGDIGGNVAVLTRHAVSEEPAAGELLTYRARLGDGLRILDQRWEAAGRIGSDYLTFDGATYQLDQPLSAEDGWPLDDIDELLESAIQTDRPRALTPQPSSNQYRGGGDDSDQSPYRFRVPPAGLILSVMVASGVYVVLRRWR